MHLGFFDFSLSLSPQNLTKYKSKTKNYAKLKPYNTKKICNNAAKTQNANNTNIFIA
jgi:hypothetical protein